MKTGPGSWTSHCAGVSTAYLILCAANTADIILPWSCSRLFRSLPSREGRRRMRTLTTPLTLKPWGKCCSEGTGSSPSQQDQNCVCLWYVKKKKKKWSGLWKIIIIMYTYHAVISALSTHMIHINLNMMFYTHQVEHSPTKTAHTKQDTERHPPPPPPPPQHTQNPQWI